MGCPSVCGCHAWQNPCDQSPARGSTFTVTLPLSSRGNSMATNLIDAEGQVRLDRVPTGIPGLDTVLRGVSPSRHLHRSRRPRNGQDAPCEPVLLQPHRCRASCGELPDSTLEQSGFELAVPPTRLPLFLRECPCSTCPAGRLKHRLRAACTLLSQVKGLLRTSKARR